jgi:hypothetical protein
MHEGEQRRLRGPDDRAEAGRQQREVDHGRKQTIEANRQQRQEDSRGR